MTAVEYLDFEIEIGPGQGREYPLAVIRSPGGEARERMIFPFDELALENRLKDLQIALLRSGGKRRAIPSPEESTVQEFGQKLFDALLSGEIRSRYDVSLERAAQRRLGLRIKLRIQAPELASLPWEFLYDGRRAEYICLSTQTPLVRYIELPQVIQPLLAEPPLQILGVIASPNDLEPLDTDNEKQRMQHALKDLVADGRAQITWLEHANRRELQRVMRRGPWHILHFIGHGGFDLASEEGFIALENERAELDRLPATQLARLLADHTSLRLAVLNSCDGAQGGRTDVFSSTASVLVRRGIPAVLAMQYAISDRAAIEFARGFYEALADDLAVDAATAEARKSVSLGLSNTIEWGTPVLHMRAADGVLFKRPSPEEVRRAEAEQEARERLLLAAAERAASEQFEHDAIQQAARQKAQNELAEQAYQEAVKKLAAEKSLRQIEEGAVAEKAAGELVKHEAAEKAAREQAEREAAEKTAGEQAEREAADKAAFEQAERESAEKDEREQAAFETAEKTAHNPREESSAEKSRLAEEQSRADLTLDLGQGVTMEFVRIPAGEFWMGSDKKVDSQARDNELPQHKVSLDEYLIGKYPVTNRQYQVFVQKTGHHAPPRWTNGSIPAGKENHPVINVNWQDSVDFCQWASKVTGLTVRLPSEAEWEKAARGTDARIHPWGNQTPDASLCNYAATKIGDTTAVGRFSPQGDSPYGCADIAGNVWEWVDDWYDACPGNTTNNTDFGTKYRVMRGGSWISDPDDLRVFVCGRYSPDLRNYVIGFRCAR
jgi:formylglycine-generating enzyme required for sulfatase activity